MSLGNCIPGLVEAGKLTKKQGEAAQQRYDKHFRVLSRDMGPAAAAAEASERAIKELQGAAKLKKRQAFLMIERQRAARRAMADYRGRAGKFELGKAAEALFVRDDRAPYANLEYREKRRRNQALALMQGVLEKHSRNLVGQVRDGAGVLDIQRELRGEKTGNVSAAELAAAVRAAQDLQLKQFNAAGGNIRKLENRGVAQFHDPYKIGQAKIPAWKGDLLAGLDLRATADAAGLVGPEEIEGYLDRVFQAVVTDGAAYAKDGGGGTGALANRRQEGRALVFKSAEAWQAYAEKYGNPNVFDAIMHETHSMARDIAAMEMFGPNPDATVRWLKDHVVNEAKRQHGAGTKEAARARASADRLDAYWETYTGANTGPRNWLSLVGSGLRAHQTISKLGGAAVTALPTDMATQTLTRAFNGMPAAKTGLDYLKYMASHGAREQAARFGFIADQSAGGFSTQARFLGAELTGEWQSRMAEGMMRMSGLNRLTDAGRDAFGMEALSHITDERAKGWTQLDRRFRRMFERYGIDEAGWDAVRSTPTIEAGGAPWIHPDRIENRAVADRVMEMIYSETDLAVVTAGLQARAAISGVGRRGTWQGEIARALFQFKAFPVATLYLHGGRMLALESGFSKAKYGAAFLGAATTAGWLALEAKALLKGEDPRALSVKTLLASMQQGGGLGIYGDFLFSTQNRAGGGFSQTILGPSASTVDAVAGLVAGAPLLQSQGEDVDYDRQLIRLLRSETPGSSLWYTRLAFDRLILDQWQAAADPDYYSSWRRLQSRAADQGTGYWWAPGETTPDRAPDLSNAGPAP